MIEEAYAKSIYDHLAVAEAAAALRGFRDALDLILAADVFIYVGNLEGIFSAAASALRAGGRLAFTIEAHAGDGFVLTATERYAHSLSYISKLAGEHGLIEEHVSSAVIRKEHSADVDGQVIVLRKPPGAP